MKKALRPPWIPSPWSEWKVSTTGRVDSLTGFSLSMQALDAVDCA
jgi:hypothetical protein